MIDGQPTLEELKADYDNWVAGMQPIEELREQSTYETVHSGSAVIIMEYVSALEAEVKRLRGELGVQE